MIYHLKLLSNKNECFLEMRFQYVLLCFNFFALTQNAELLLDVEAYRYFTGLFTIQGDSQRSFPHFFQRLCK